MNQVLLIARYQFLMAVRAIKKGFYFTFFSIAVLLLLLGMLSFFAPFNFLFLALPLFSFYAINAISLNLLRTSYELDVSNISVYPISNSSKFNLLFLVDLFHINGIIYLLSLVILFITTLVKYSLPEGLLLFSVFTVYWFFFTAFYLTLRTLCRRNYTFYYIIRFSGSIIVLGYLFARPVSRGANPLRVIDWVNNVPRVPFLLYSIVALAVLFFLVDRLFVFYIKRNPFPDPQLARKFITNRWR